MIIFKSHLLIYFLNAVKSWFYVFFTLHGEKMVFISPGVQPGVENGDTFAVQTSLGPRTTDYPLSKNTKKSI